MVTIQDCCFSLVMALVLVLILVIVLVLVQLAVMFACPMTVELFCISDTLVIAVESSPAVQYVPQYEGFVCYSDGSVGSQGTV